MANSTYQHLYDRRWYKARSAYLKAYPLCADHEARGMIVAAEVVDHIVPHRGDLTRFWDPSNWQPLCRHCHDSRKQRAEKSGRAAGCGADGLPADPRHRWSGGRGG